VPRAQVRADAERDEELRPLRARELLDRVDVEVVVVVVADDDGVDRGQRIQCRGRFVKPLRADGARR
jgi:hypothetical protein